MVKKVWQTDSRTDGRTDRRTDWTSHITAWSQLKKLKWRTDVSACFYVSPYQKLNINLDLTLKEVDITLLVLPDEGVLTLMYRHLMWCHTMARNEPMIIRRYWYLDWSQWLVFFIPLTKPRWGIGMAFQFSWVNSWFTIDLPRTVKRKRLHHHDTICKSCGTKPSPVFNSNSPSRSIDTMRSHHSAMLFYPLTYEVENVFLWRFSCDFLVFASISHAGVSPN